MFSSARTGNRNIWSARADLSHPIPLTVGTAIDERPTFSPDGTQVAFVSDRGARRGVWVVGANGGVPRLIVAADVLDTISWSPDGRALVYAVPGREVPGLMVVSVSDGRTARLATPGAANAPAWSPREDVIAYLESQPSQGSPLRFVNSRGEPAYQALTASEQFLGGASLQWSPDGRRLAIVRLPGTNPGSIWVLEPDAGPTSFRKLLDLPPGSILRGLTWAPDSSSIIIGRAQGASDIVFFERSR